jgi:aryl-alcohol dehydrogenase-like predicted oxidoreductase
LIGAFRSRLIALRGAAAADKVHVHTKFVPDLAILTKIDRNYVRDIVDRSLRRLRVERLDLVQFHWWTYAAPGLLETAHWLDELRREGKIRNLGLTNFDQLHLKEIVGAGIEVLSVQIQYSALDQRPQSGFAAVCQKLGVWLFCYGSVAGGFLSDRWLGTAEPTTQAENRSLVKYKLIIDDFGGWDLFQELLRGLRRVADRRGVDIATIASRYVLGKPGVAAVIVGARDRTHVVDNARIASVALAEDDAREIDVIVAQSSGPRGDVYALERDLTGRHGSIMHYNLNAKT